VIAVSAQIVIGDSQTNITLVPVERGESGWETTGSFQIQRLRGEFRTLLISPERFIDELEDLDRNIAGGVSLFGMDDDFSVVLTAKRLGGVSVEAAVRDNFAYDAKFNFEIDQTYAAPLIRSLRSAFSVVQ
jgi:hypothetical protein